MVDLCDLRSLILEYATYMDYIRYRSVLHIEGAVSVVLLRMLAEL